MRIGGGMGGMGQMGMVGFGPNASAGSNSLTVGNSVRNGVGNSASVNLSLTTTKGSGLIVVCGLINGVAFGTVTDGTNTYTPIDTTNAFSAASNVNLWTAPFSSNTAWTINVPAFSGTTFIEACAFEIGGVNATPNDSGGPQHSSSTFPAITTANANDIIIATEATNDAASTASGGFTQLFGTNFLNTSYQIVSATQSGLALSLSLSTPAGGIIHAIKSS